MGGRWGKKGNRMQILAIDPGTTQSAYVVWNMTYDMLFDFGILPNLEILWIVKKNREALLKIEMVGHYGAGMPAGKSVFETCIWIGAFIEAYGHMNIFQDCLILRKTIVTHLCGSPRAKDSNVRQALIDRFGEPGTKKNPGRLYGVKKDIWSALALAVYTADIMKGGKIR